MILGSGDVLPKWELQGTVSVHAEDAYPSDVVVSKDFSALAVGDFFTIQLVQGDNGRRKLFQVEEIVKSVGPGVNISIKRSVADRYGLSLSRSSVHIRKCSNESIKEYGLKHIEIVLKDEYVTRGTMWRLQNQLVGRVVYQGQRYEYCGNRVTIKNIFDNENNAVFSGMVADAAAGCPTQFTFRSDSIRQIWLVQLSREMWEDNGYGDLYFEVFADGIARDILERWTKGEQKHRLTIIFFGRTRDLQANTNTDSSTDADNDSTDSTQHDYFRVVARDVGYSEWKDIPQLLKKAFANWPARVGWNFGTRVDDVDAQDSMLDDELDMQQCSMGDESTAGERERSYSSIVGSSMPPAELLCSSEGNVLEALQLCMELCDRHYDDRPLNLTGHRIAFFTAGPGFFVCRDKRLLKYTEERISGAGMGCDFVFLRHQQPHHRIPLFLYSDKVGGDTKYLTPQWVHVLLYDRGYSGVNDPWSASCDPQHVWYAPSTPMLNQVSILRTQTQSSCLIPLLKPSARSARFGNRSELSLMMHDSSIFSPPRKAPGLTRRPLSPSKADVPMSRRSFSAAVSPVSKKTSSSGMRRSVSRDALAHAHPHAHTNSPSTRSMVRRGSGSGNLVDSAFHMAADDFLQTHPFVKKVCLCHYCVCRRVDPDDRKDTTPTASGKDELVNKTVKSRSSRWEHAHGQSNPDQNSTAREVIGYLEKSSDCSGYSVLGPHSKAEDWRSLLQPAFLPIIAGHEYVAMHRNSVAEDAALTKAKRSTPLKVGLEHLPSPPVGKQNAAGAQTETQNGNDADEAPVHARSTYTVLTDQGPYGKPERLIEEMICQRLQRGFQIICPPKWSDSPCQVVTDFQRQTLSWTNDSDTIQVDSDNTQAARSLKERDSHVCKYRLWGSEDGSRQGRWFDRAVDLTRQYTHASSYKWSEFDQVLSSYEPATTWNMRTFKCHRNAFMLLPVELSPDQPNGNPSSSAADGPPTRSLDERRAAFKRWLETGLLCRQVAAVDESTDKKLCPNPADSTWESVRNEWSEARLDFEFSGNDTFAGASKTRTPYQWMWMRYQSVFRPDEAFVFEFMWIVASGGNMDDYMQTITRKARQGGFRLYPLPCVAIDGNWWQMGTLPPFSVPYVFQCSRPSLVGLVCEELRTRLGMLPANRNGTLMVSPHGRILIRIDRERGTVHWLPNYVASLPRKAVAGESGDTAKPSLSISGRSGPLKAARTLQSFGSEAPSPSRAGSTDVKPVTSAFSMPQIFLNHEKEAAMEYAEVVRRGRVMNTCYELVDTLLSSIDFDAHASQTSDTIVGDATVPSANASTAGESNDVVDGLGLSTGGNEHRDNDGSRVDNGAPEN